jgi:tetratricopeptide (TPR) repeat protein
MELTTMMLAVVLTFGLLGTDTVIHRGSVAVEVAAIPKIDNISIDEGTISAEFDDQLDMITQTSSVVRPLEIRSRAEIGVGMALAEALGAQNIAYAFQRQLGYRPDSIRYALFVEGNTLHALISGRSHLIGSFRQVLSPHQGEPLIAFVQRGAMWAASQLAPYSCALYLLQKHSVDRDFSDVVALIHQAKGLLPATPTSFDRSLFENLLGLVALFKDDPPAARAAFAAAIASDPSNPVPFLNAAFTDIQLNDYTQAAARMESLIRLAPPANQVLLASAYATWGAALMGLRDLPGADRMLAKAVSINPHSATALNLWAEEKQLEGDHTAQQRLAHLAAVESATFENYGEVAALYFRLAWQDDAPVARNKFANPEIVTFH